MRPDATSREVRDAVSRLGSCKSVIQVFADAARHAVVDLVSADLAQLERCWPTVESLGWLESDERQRLAAFLDILSQRGANRWGLNAGQRKELLACVGGPTAIASGRVLFELAVGIDRAFDTSNRTLAEISWHMRAGVVRPPEAFLAESSNLPPRIGQMTPLLVVRRWFRNLWLAPQIERFEGLGRMPKCHPASLEPSIVRRFKEARDRDELRVALVTWPRHLRQDLGLAGDVPDGCFAVETVSRVPLNFEPLLALLASKQAHVAVLPELALVPDEVAELSQVMRARDAKYPLLLVGGITHQRGDGGHVNEAFVFDSVGREVFRHEKLEPFTDTHHGLGLENIVPRTSERYIFVDTPVGRVVVNICRDFRSDVPLVLNRLLEATLLLVPAYSTDLAFVADEAPLLGQRQLAITAATNAAMEDCVDAGYFYAPVRSKTQRRGWPVLHATPPAGRGSAILFSVGFGPGRVAKVGGPDVFEL